MGFDIGKAVGGGLTGFAAGGPLGAAAGALGGGLAGSGGVSVPQIQFNPANVTSGSGQVSFDKESNTLTSGLSDPFLDLQQGLFSQGGGFLEQAGTFDPDEFGAKVTDRLRNLAAPQEEQARLALENRNFQQGLFSSSIGNQRSESLFTAQALADEARVARGFSLGQDVQGNLVNRGLALQQQGIGLEQLPQNLLGTSLAAGRGNLGADDANAARMFENRQNEADASSALISGAIGGISSFSGADFGGMFDDFFGGTTAFNQGQQQTGTAFAPGSADEFLNF